GLASPAHGRAGAVRRCRAPGGRPDDGVRRSAGMGEARGREVLDGRPHPERLCPPGAPLADRAGGRTTARLGRPASSETPAGGLAALAPAAGSGPQPAVLRLRARERLSDAGPVGAARAFGG